VFTVAITLVFSQVAAPKVGLAEVRAGDVLLGAAIGMAAGLLAWPRGAGGELRRATGRLLAAGGDLVRQTAGLLTQPGSPARPVLAVEDPGTVDRAQDAMTLADASYSMYQAERHGAQESTVDWDAIFVAGQQIVRGSDLLRTGNSPGQLAPWRDLVEGSANQVAGECRHMAAALNRGQHPRAEPVELFGTADSSLFEMQDWLAAIHDDLTRVGRAEA
jgi:uncharacterized membrane protein YccC